MAEWLREWLEKAIKPPAKRLGTYRKYKHVLETGDSGPRHSAAATILKASDLNVQYTDQKLSSSTLAQHHAILSSALKAAVLDGLVTRNVAPLVIGKPHANRDHEQLAQNCWEADEARAFLAAAKKAGSQMAAFGALALDSGARKGELCGVRWSDLDLEAGTVTFVRQLVAAGKNPVFGPIKNDMPRTVDLGSETGCC